jgi:hypothetical protein
MVTDAGMEDSQALSDDLLAWLDDLPDGLDEELRWKLSAFEHMRTIPYHTRRMLWNTKDESQRLQMLRTAVDAMKRSKY